MKKFVLVWLFVLLGIGFGSVSVWYRRHFDTPFILNMPGYLASEGLSSLWVRCFHDAPPWLLKVPQVYVPVSALFWGLAGLASLSFKPRIGLSVLLAYFMVAGCFTLLHLFP